MKKIIVILLIFLFSFVIVVNASSTGHENITDIEFIEGGSLIIDMNESYLKDCYKKAQKWRFFGWSTFYINTNAEAKYIGEIIFSRANLTSSPYVFDYYLEQEESVERSISVTGSVTTRLKGKIKVVDGQLDTDIEGKIGKKTIIIKTEETNFKITIPCNTKITLRETGEAKISNGVSCYYFFGIRIKKGSWEYIDLETKYYELVEEKVK